MLDFFITFLNYYAASVLILCKKTLWVWLLSTATYYYQS